MAGILKFKIWIILIKKKILEPLTGKYNKEMFYEHSFWDYTTTNNRKIKYQFLIVGTEAIVMIINDK